MPGDCTLLSLDASHAIPTHVLRFEDFGLRRRTPVRPVLLTQRKLARLAACDATVRPMACAG
jgi:hypothetical protein